MNTLLNYPGAKWGMASQIVALMPPHRSYLEPFFGSGAVLFNKPPSAIETVNDIDGDIVNFFRVLREQPDDLAEAISLTPYAREVFEDAHANRGTDDFDRAYRLAIRFKMGHGFKAYQKTGFKIDVHARERSYCVGCWNRLPADPPYLMETRCGKQYRHEMNEQDHLELLEALKQHKGSVIISGYPSGMYDRELRGWSVIHRKSYNQNSDQRTEVLWCNFELPGLFEGIEEI